MEHNYLDRYPSSSIARQIEAEPLDHRWYDQIIGNANAYIKIMEHENIDFLEARQRPDLSAGDTYKLLRSQERTRNSKLMLQYLITFLSDMPLEKDLVDKPVNPFEQMKSFVMYSIRLLKEKDVAAAILKEHEKLGLLNDTNMWYYRGQIDKNYKTLSEGLEQATRPTIECYCILFRSLQQLCVFWFSVRQEDPNRVRNSDVLIYKLTRLLLEKHENK